MLTTTHLGSRPREAARWIVPFIRWMCILAPLCVIFGGCRHPTPAPAENPQDESSATGTLPLLRYVGSSTIGNFLREAEPVYGRAQILVDLGPESLGGEELILTGDTDFAGIAREPQLVTLESGVQATLIGVDTIVVVVHVTNSVTNLSTQQLAGIFTGKMTNWQEVGGADLPILPLIVADNSATHHVFRKTVLRDRDYGAACKVIRPDANIPRSVEVEKGAIGMVSYSFVCAGGAVRVLNVDGEDPLPDNVKYPIVRPLYLLWKPSNSEVAKFIAWCSTLEAEQVIIKCFGRRRHVKG